MTLAPRTVLIPMTGSTEDRGRMARVQATITATHQNPANLAPTISALSDWGLYEAGAIAQGAVSRLKLKARIGALWQRLRPSPIPVYLTVTNGPDIIGLNTENSESAELGLALAMVMVRCQSTDHAVVATGALSRDAGPQAAGDDQVAVLPVGGLSGKFKAFQRALTEQKGGAHPSRFKFLIPHKTLDGDETLQTHAADIAALETACAEQGIACEVVPCATLREACRAVGADRLHASGKDRAFSTAVMIILVAAIAGAGIASWMQSEIPMTFVNVADATGQSFVTPVRQTSDAGISGLRFIQACDDGQNLPIYRDGDQLVVRIRAKSDWLADLTGGLRFAFVGISEQSGLKVFQSRIGFGMAAARSSGPAISLRGPLGRRRDAR